MIWWYYLIEVAIFGVFLTLDLVSKTYITAFLKSRPLRNHVLIPNVLELQYSQNTGASFGMLKNSTTALTVIVAIALVAILAFLVIKRKENRELRLPLIFIFTGGLGNLIDRVAFGYVRDFIYLSFIDFPIFNIADMCITIGAFWLIICLIFDLIKEIRNENTAKLEETVENIRGRAVSDEEAKAIIDEKARAEAKLFSDIDIDEIKGRVISDEEAEKRLKSVSHTGIFIDRTK
ncbi:MAG: signal peptidase II [Clostridiales bacterium]|nr:signal peptidase II [Clostridiales bacterium]